MNMNVLLEADRYQYRSRGNLLINSITSVFSISLFAIGLGMIVSTFQEINWEMVSNICECSYLINMRIVDSMGVLMGITIGTLLILLSLPSIFLIDWIVRHIVEKVLRSKEVP